MADADQHKTRNQLRRAHKLVAVLDQLAETTDAHRLDFARTLPIERWADLAYLAQITVPSATTIAMAIGLIEARVLNEQMTADDDFMAFAGMDAR
jgi:hypothetical protein